MNTLKEDFLNYYINSNNSYEIKLEDPNDIAFSNIAQGGLVTNATLPSG